MPKNIDMIPGTSLAPKLQQDALNSFVHRYTGEHVPSWSKEKAPNGKHYAPQYQNDAEWLSKTLFPVVTDKQGLMSIQRGNDVHCMSNQASFPWGQWLDQPFKKGMPVPEVPSVQPGMQS